MEADRQHVLQQCQCRDRGQRSFPFQDYDEEIFDRVIAVNLKGVFLGLRHVLPVMLKQGSGTIVNTASVAGLFGAPGMPAYVASKHGVLGLTKVAATDVAGSGVRVTRCVPDRWRHG